MLFGAGGASALIIRYAIYLDGDTPAFSGGAWAGSPVAQGYEAARSDTGEQTFPSVEGLTPGTSYRVAFVLGDDASTLVVSAPWETLAEAQTLVVSSAYHAQSAGNVALTAEVALLISPSQHTHAADNAPLLSGGATLDVAQGQHAQATDHIELSAAVALVSHDAVHAHLADTASFTGAADLAVQDASHAHAAEAPDVVIGLAITIAHAFHDHVSSCIDLSAALGLSIESALHTHGADEALLTAALNLAVDDAFHEHMGEHLVFVVPVPLVDLLRRSVFLRAARQRAVVRTQDQRIFGRVERSGIFLKAR